MSQYGDTYSYKIEVSANTAQAQTITAEVGKFAKATDQAAAATVAQNRAYVQARDAQGRFIKGAHEAADAQERLRKETDRAAASLGKGGSGGQALLQFAQLADDAQYGVRGILNNIPMLAMSLGGGAGLAGAVSLVALGVDQLIRRAPGLADMFKAEDLALFGQTLGTLKARLDDLTSKEYRLEVDSSAVDAARDALSQAEESLKRFEAISRQQTSIQSESAKRVAEAVAEFGGASDTETGGQNLQRAIRDQLMGTPEAQKQRAEADAAVARARAAVQATVDDPLGTGPELATATRVELEKAERRRKELAERQRTEADTRARGMIGGALGGSDEAILGLRGIVGGNAGFFGGRGVGPGFLGALESARPGAVAAQRRAEEEARLDEQIRQAEEELKRQQEQQQREAEAAQKKTQAEEERAAAEREKAAQDAARPIVEGAGPGIEAALLGGASPEQAGAELMDGLRRFGFTVEEAFTGALRAVEEADARLRQRIQAEQARNAMQFGAMAPRRTNRPFGP